MVVGGRRTWSGAHVTVRPAYPSDGEALARLGAELEYETDAAETVRRLQALPATDCVFVARTASGVIGLLHLSVVRGLFEPPFVEIAAIVVMQAWRGVGIGKKLVQHAEAWVSGEHMSRVDVGAQYLTPDARAFFLHLGYVEAEVGQVLTKDVV